ncbi:MAG: hypothetical protein K2X93_09345 [Candidatus Obscuribacterales bacterium]|nr:hypothetical protein [Candidatus Obscuribacterales bacterium]
MKVRNIAALAAFALSIPLAFQGACLAQESNLTPVNGQAVTDTQANIDMAKDRLEKSKVRLEIAQKQVDAAKARLKAADAEFKAAKANHDARTLDHQAKKLSDASGLPEISEGQIEQGRTKSLALKEVEQSKEATPVVPAAPIDLSKTRLQQVDFNAQPEGDTSAPAPSPESAVPAPDKQASMLDGFHAATPRVAATSTEQPPIVP